MRPIGIMSIPRAQTPEPDRKFDHLMGAVGHNTGNLLFTNAVWQQLKGRKKRLGFHFQPDGVNTTLSALVIPAANWLGPHVDFSKLADLVEQLDIPVILIGLGAQNHRPGGRLHIPDGTLRFVRAVSARSHSISVRGAYTKKVLAGHGIRNVTVTGCPSLYVDFQPDAGERLLAARQSATGPTLLHSTRYSARHRPFIDEPSVHRDLYRFAFEHGIDLLLQSEPEEIGMRTPATGKPELDAELKALMVELYGAPSWRELKTYIRQHARVFFSIKRWSRAMTGYGQAFGTRLHATIMALNSGVPAVLVSHDSRTQELAEFARLPALTADQAKISLDAIRHQLKAIDVGSYVATRRENALAYREFLSGNGIEPRNRPVTQPAA